MHLKNIRKTSIENTRESFQYFIQINPYCIIFHWINATRKLLFYATKQVRKRLTNFHKMLPFVQQLFKMFVCVTYIRNQAGIRPCYSICPVYQKCALNVSIYAHVWLSPISSKWKSFRLLFKIKQNNKWNSFEAAHFTCNNIIQSHKILNKEGDSYRTFKVVF